MTDPITDMLNQIRNAQAVEKTEVVLFFSKLKSEIATLLVAEGFLADIKKVAKGKVKMLKLGLKYNTGVPAIEGSKRVSKPGQRIYAGFDELKKVRGGVWHFSCFYAKRFNDQQSGEKTEIRRRGSFRSVVIDRLLGIAR